MKSFFKDLQIRKPDHFLSAAGSTAAETIGNIISKIDLVLEKEKPEALLILGDTNSCLAAISAKRRKIPIFHMEAGNRCFDQRVPEEINRKIVDHISDINLPYSDIAREYLLREGLLPDRVIKTGSPMFEVLNYFRKEIAESKVLSHFSLQPKHYFVVSVHREENVDVPENLENIRLSLNAVASTYGVPLIVSTHPRTRKRIEAGELKFHPLIQLQKPLGFFDYNALQKSAKAVLSDSGTISEESSILDFPALNLRQAHERPEAMEEASVMMVGISPSRIQMCLEALFCGEAGHSFSRQMVSDYSMPNVSDKVVQLIFSYTDYIRRVVWQNL